MRRHWITKAFAQDIDTGEPVPLSLATIYITDIHEILIWEIYPYKEGKTFLANPFISSSMGVISFWLEEDIDYILMLAFIPGLLPSWFTWLQGVEPSKISTSYEALKRLCKINDIT